MRSEQSTRLCARDPQRAQGEAGPGGSACSSACIIAFDCVIGAARRAGSSEAAYAFRGVHLSVLAVRVHADIVGSWRCTDTTYGVQLARPSPITALVRTLNGALYVFVCSLKRYSRNLYYIVRLILSGAWRSLTS